jgi:hypothetical protein
LNAISHVFVVYQAGYLRFFAMLQEITRSLWTYQQKSESGRDLWAGGRWLPGVFSHPSLKPWHRLNVSFQSIVLHYSSSSRSNQGFKSCR